MERRGIKPLKPLDIPIKRKLKLQRMFKRLDTDSSGEIDTNEIRNALAMINETGIQLPFNSDNLIAKFKEVDADGSGEIGMKEYAEPHLSILHTCTYDKRQRQIVIDR